MFGNPQDIVAILAGAALIFGTGGAIVRGKLIKSHDAAKPEPAADAEGHAT